MRVKLLGSPNLSVNFSEYLPVTANDTLIFFDGYGRLSAEASIIVAGGDVSDCPSDWPSVRVSRTYFYVVRGVGHFLDVYDLSLNTAIRIVCLCSLIYHI